MAFEIIGLVIAAITITTARTIGHFFLFIMRNERLIASLFINNPPNKLCIINYSLSHLGDYVNRLFADGGYPLDRRHNILNGYLAIAAFLRTGCHRESISVDLILNILLHYMPAKRHESQIFYSVNIEKTYIIC